MSYPIYSAVVEDDTLPVFFSTYGGTNGESVTLSGLAVTDIEIYKDGSITQRSSDAGISLIDTDGIDIDGVTGIHGFTIDLSDNTDAGFYAVDSWYHVVVSSVTVDSQTVSFIACAFRIVSATRGTAGTALPNAAADAAGGLPISDAGGLDLDAKVGALTFTVANQLDANAVAISGDATAADNLEATFDGTGYTDGAAPATQDQVSAIAAASIAGFPTEATADNTGGAIKSVTFVGVQTSGTYASTEAEDGTYHQIDDTTNAIDIVYSFNVTGARLATEVAFTGYLSSANDTITVQAYDFVGTDWETRGTISGQASSNNINRTFTLLSKHTGTGSDIGTVLIRFVCSGQSTPTLYVDSLLVTGANLGQSVGYEGGKIWVDTNNGVAGTVSFVNGTADNPVDTWADALTLSAALGIQRFALVGGSSITLTASCDNYFFDAPESTIALGGQSIEGAFFFGATITGADDGTQSTPARFIDCRLGAVSLAGGGFGRCALTDTFTATGAATYLLDGCFSGIAGTATPTFDFGAAVGNTALNMRHYSGGIEIQNMGGTGADTMSLEGDGQLVINANCTGGTVAIRGNFFVKDNAAGAVTTSTPQSLRSSVNDVSATTTSFVTALPEASIDDAYRDRVLVFTTGNNKGIARVILTYTASTKTVTFDEAFPNSPADADEFVVYPVHVHAESRIADAVWDEATSGHSTAGTTGKALTDVLSDTNELQTDWTDGGRLDLILDAVPSAATNASTLLASTADGVAVSEILRQLLALGVGGKFTYDANTGVLERFAQDGTTSLGSITLTATGGTPV